MSRLHRIEAVLIEGERGTEIALIRNEREYDRLRTQMIAEKGIEWVEKEEKEIITNAGY